jgi:GWxTD domain-containing protein
MNTALTTALAGALFHFLWEGAALALLAGFALLLLRNPRARCGAACAALFAMPVAFMITAAILYSPKPLAANAIRLTQLGAAAPGAGLLLGQSLPWYVRVEQSMRAFVPFWFVGIALLYLRSAAGWFTVRSLRREAHSCGSSQWRERAAALARKLGVNHVVTLLESHRIDVPVVAGFLRPAILLPVGCLTNMSADQIELLLAHELAHIRRLDYLVNLAQKAIEGLLFYHPAVWWVSNVIRREREYCCDDVVLALGSEPGRYASALAGLEQNRVALAPAATGGDLSSRIRRILRSPSADATPAPILAAILLAISGALVFAAVQQQDASQSAKAALQAELAAPWDRWVNEDVAYIITDEERRAFRALTSDAERERFVEQFWLRRDPTPGTPENEFKEEHYRRIAYVNLHYADNNVAGWKTDRGRIYITFGPPDEIDSHPSCAGANTAKETWRYRFIEGIGDNVLIEFDDPTCTGEYRMVPDRNGVAVTRPPQR